MRNLIVHAYDAIDPITLWRIIIKDLPVLKVEVQRIKGQ
ncbi:MAG: HepT-like ribonuclease domain-containing protein [Bacteroidia bacterium]